MARSMGRGAPRYIFHMAGHSALIERLVTLAGGHLR